MAIELKVPQVGESITEVQIGAWLKQPGERAEKDEPIVEIESDKATVELPAPVSGVIAQILKKRGETAAVGETIGLLEEGAAVGGSNGATAPAPAPQKEAAIQKKTAAQTETAPPAAAPAPRETRPVANPPRPAPLAERPAPKTAPLTVAEKPPTAPAVKPTKPAPAPRPMLLSTAAGREEEIIPMTMIRRKIASRLVEAQQNAALLTTFNEVDMTAVIHLRKEQGNVFQEMYGVKLGFMSFFVKATIEALKMFPQINAEIRGDNIVYRNYYDIGIAVGGGKGLVVPVVRNAERMSFAEIEIAINDLAARARDNKLKIEELEGGTFTISNGGVYGSLLSTPIINPPQSGILGLHAIQDRPVARDGNVVIRSMMYLALTYDHRIVDGREAVTFLRRIKEIIENPLRMLLEV
ncbi:MAG TPA: 2-oxoglutarate dehydrogenase complex dihydrolipoyllysine-residue succinyltransferase [Pirellulales bacterium]|jgi:2-oxoglutarate dehydrogenase E2 component (dihydrolipoamide succinyltransferase)|nr:2-oxoglutarate dehydrogenase complex dihydrolipoyllysine-residue succinyltransferase [Pirellulales bacterium]